MGKRVEFTMEEAKYDRLAADYKNKGYPTIAKFVVAAVDQLMEKCFSDVPLEPKTDDEKLNVIAEEMGRLKEENNDKFAAILQALPDSLPYPESMGELSNFINKVWEIILENNGALTYRKKQVAISRRDLSKYERAHALRIEKKAILAAKQVENSPQNLSGS